MRVIRCLAAVLILGFVFEAFGYQPTVTRSVNRAGSAYHKLGYETLTPPTIPDIGGVLSQTNKIDYETAGWDEWHLRLSDDEKYPGYVEVKTSNHKVRYAIEYDDLVPAVLFVDSAATSLYTFWDEEDLPNGFAQQAGFIRHNGPGFVALEFAETRFAEALHFLDTCGYCVGSSVKGLAEKANEEISAYGHGSDTADEASQSYINSDLGAQYVLNVNSDEAVVRGEIVRYYWKISKTNQSNVYIRDARRVVNPSELTDRFEKEKHQVRELSKTIRSLLDAADVSALELAKFDAETSQIIKRIKKTGFVAENKLRDVTFLFETLALLRAAKTENRQKWESFVQEVKAPRYLETFGATWERYSTSVCVVYPELQECEPSGR